MTTETFFANFGHLADAPNGVKRLRELILQLAVQGRLVPQDPEDEPASVLLDRIEAEKKRLVEKGKIKKLTTAEPVKGEEQPFAAPQGWKWPRLNSICSYIQRGKGPQYVDKSDVPVVSQKCVQWAGFSLAPARFICPMSLDKYAEERFLQTGDLLWNSTGTGTIGRINVYVHEENPYELVVADSHVTVVRPVFVNSRYVWIWLASPFIQADLEGNASGSTNQVEMATSVVKAHVIPLPPLEEQKRIVAKVDQLMTLCDELETRQKKQQQGKVRLNNAALDKLLTAREPVEFADHWQRISTNFDLLYDHPETIAKLRAAILQLAVQGKLVPQDPNDEPAEVLLERIRAEKERLVKNVTARKSILPSHIKKSEHPFLLPAGWTWVRLGDFGLFLGGGTPSKQNPSFWSGEIPWVSPKDMKVQNISDSIDHVSQEAVDNSSAKLIPEGALLMVVRGMILLHSFPVAKTVREVTINQDMKALICALPEISEYLLRSLIAEKVRILDRVERSSHGTCRLESDKLSEFVVALPPLAEQKRIVAKVDQLMSQCDELETKLNQAQQRSDKLMNATVRQLLVA